MKISHIIAIGAIAIGIGVVISTADNASSYVNLSEAMEMFEKGSEAEVHIIGELKKDSEGKVSGVKYNPLDPNYLEFIIVDENKAEQTVITNNIPTMSDFYKSEKVVVVGKFGKKGSFVASSILMKCPSKYEEKELQG